MAGLGETFVHVAAVLLYLEAAAGIQGKQTSMQRKCEWIMPSPFQLRISTSPLQEREKNNTWCYHNCHHENPPRYSTANIDITPANEADIDASYDALISCGTKPATV